MKTIIAAAAVCVGIIAANSMNNLENASMPHHHGHIAANQMPQQASMPQN